MNHSVTGVAKRCVGEGVCHVRAFLRTSPRHLSSIYFSLWHLPLLSLVLNKVSLPQFYISIIWVLKEHKKSNI